MEGGGGDRSDFVSPSEGFFSYYIEGENKKKKEGGGGGDLKEKRKLLSQTGPELQVRVTDFYSKISPKKLHII